MVGYLNGVISVVVSTLDCESGSASSNLAFLPKIMIQFPYSNHRTPSMDWMSAQAAKPAPKKLSPEMVANLLDAADLIQVKFDEYPELKELYYDQFSQLLDTAVKNSVISA